MDYFAEQVRVCENIEVGFGTKIGEDCGPEYSDIVFNYSDACVA